MKGSPGALVASVLAASTAALTSDSGDQNVACHPWSNEGRVPSSSGSEVRADARCSAEDKFAPRFDGLRFIETLVTAHR